MEGQQQQETSAVFTAGDEDKGLAQLEPIVPAPLAPAVPPPTLVEGGEPVWVSPHLRRWFDRVVGLTFRQPTVFYHLAPMPWCVSVFGREGADKARAVEVLLREHDLSEWQCVTVQNGATNAALDAIECAAKAAWIAGAPDYGKPLTAEAIVAAGGAPPEMVDFERLQRPVVNRSIIPLAQQAAGVLDEDRWMRDELVRDPTPRYVVVVDHADRLIYTPDNWAAMERACALRARVAERYGVLLILLFDRLMDESDTLARITPRERELHDQFKEQFDKPTGYLTAPDADYRVALFRWCFEDFAAHCRAVHRPVAVVLADDEYVTLTNYATFTTPDDVRGWCRYVHLELLREPTQVVLNWEFLRARIPEATGTPHIHYLGGDELLAVETRFSTACGCGPVHVRDNRSRIANVEVDADDTKQRSKAEEEEEELLDPEADMNVTGFSCDAAALDKASQLLDRQQHPKRRAKRSQKLADMEAAKQQQEDEDVGKKRPRQRAGDFSYTPAARTTKKTKTTRRKK